MSLEALKHHIVMFDAILVRGRVFLITEGSESIALFKRVLVANILFAVNIFTMFNENNENCVIFHIQTVDDSVIADTESTMTNETIS